MVAVHRPIVVVCLDSFLPVEVPYFVSERPFEISLLGLQVLNHRPCSVGAGIGLILASVDFSGLKVAGDLANRLVVVSLEPAPRRHLALVKLCCLPGFQLRPVPFRVGQHFILSLCLSSQVSKLLWVALQLLEGCLVGWASVTDPLPERFLFKLGPRFARVLKCVFEVGVGLGPRRSNLF